MIRRRPPAAIAPAAAAASTASAAPAASAAPPSAVASPRVAGPRIVAPQRATTFQPATDENAAPGQFNGPPGVADVNHNTAGSMDFAPMPTGNVRLVSHVAQEIPLRQPARLAAYSAPEVLPEPEAAPVPLIEPVPDAAAEKLPQPAAQEVAGEQIELDEIADPLQPLFGSALGIAPQELAVDDCGCGGSSGGECAACGSTDSCDCGLCIDPCSKPGRFLSYFTPSCGGGIGLQRVGLAPFELDVTEPFNHFDIQVNPVSGINAPDRAEYFWPKATRGVPAVEESVSYQDLRVRMEVGNDFVSNITEVPLRFLDPQINGNTTGLGDMSTAVKTRLFQGATLNISQIMRTYFNTGSVTHGLSTGHISIEPGLLARYEWDERTFMFGEVKFWVPMGGDPTHSGEVLRYGAGISHLWIDNDSFAAIPVLEFVAWNVLDGQQTLPASQQPVVGGPATRDIDGDIIFNIFPGMRFTFKGGENFDLFELGVNGGVALSNQRWYNAQMRFEGRWMF